MQSTNQSTILRFIIKLGLAYVVQSLKEILDPATPPPPPATLIKWVCIFSKMNILKHFHEGGKCDEKAAADEPSQGASLAFSRKSLKLPLEGGRDI